MLEFLFFLLGLTLLAIIVNVCIRIFVIKPSQIAKIHYFIDDGKLAEALFYVNMRLKRQPDNLVLTYWRGEIMWRMSNRQAAAEVLENLNLPRLKRMPAYYTQALFRLGTWYYEQGDLTKAAQYFEQLLSTKTDNPEYFYGGALLALKENDSERAILLLKKALEKTPASVEILQLLGSTYMQLESYPEAYSVYARLTQIHPDDPQIWLRLAEIAYKGGNMGKAIKFYNKAETFPAPKERFDAALGLCAIYKNTGEMFQGIQSLSKAIAYAKPEFCPTKLLLGLYYDLADLYVAVDEIDQAVRQWATILKIDPLYRDVSVKYAEFSHLRLTDFLKDLLTLNSSRLLETIMGFIKGLGLTVDSYNQNQDQSIDIFTVENAGKWRYGRKVKTMFSFWCTTEPVPGSFVNDLKFRQNVSGASRVILISAAPVLSETRLSLARRSIDLYDADNISNLGSKINSSMLTEEALEP